MTHQDTCGTCRFWQAMQTKSDTGWCLRFAPRPLMNSGGRLVGWPLTDRQHSCGEFQAALRLKMARMELVQEQRKRA